MILQNSNTSDSVDDMKYDIWGILVMLGIGLHEIFFDICYAA